MGGMNVNKSSAAASNNSEYVPEGLTKEQYLAIVKRDQEKKEANKKRFENKKVESLTEWMEENEKKGLKGKDMNRFGHRMVKVKYEEFYAKEIDY